MCAIVDVPNIDATPEGPSGGHHDEPASPSILIVSPVRNESAYIERVVRAVAAQELAPTRWIVIDDGSDDATLEVLRTLEAEVPFLEVVGPGEHADEAGDRLARALEAVNFNRGLVLADRSAFTHIMKL